MGMVDLEYIGDCVRAMEAGKRLSPYFVPRILPNLAAGHIAIEHGLRYRFASQKDRRVNRVVFPGVQIIAAVQLVPLEPTVLGKVFGFCKMGRLR